MDVEAVRGLIANGEGQRIEFKTSFGEDNAAIETLCAFTHADGGTVFFGVTDDQKIVGVDIGKNTLENFANKLRAETRPLLAPSVETIDLGGKTVVIGTIRKAGDNELFYAFNRPYVRVGKSNLVMPPEQQRARLQAPGDHWAEERDRPRFESDSSSVTRLEKSFEPSWTLRRVSGDYVPNAEWRFRGPRFQMDWRQATGASLERTSLSEKFDLTKPPIDDELVELDQMGLEIRFHWRGKLRHELHRYPITRRVHPNKVLWDVGREIIPPLYFDENEPSTLRGATVAADSASSSRKEREALLVQLGDLKASAAKIVNKPPPRNSADHDRWLTDLEQQMNEWKESVEAVLRKLAPAEAGNWKTIGTYETKVKGINARHTRVVSLTAERINRLGHVIDKWSQP